MPRREKVYEGSVKVTDEEIVDAETGEPLDLDALREGD